ncbi:hypothetical protein SCHPADRAFT_940812 [Schizopora paradoxa]|uniref:Uncharacterized protein n=1 Tax=Schizopora paradoxa TaxID=27342 RepID=A0A0H2S7Z0_9AGAM|nr:hypothetical protein SCHPADRAFT_940812 [Schizopora paradoxa]
MLFARVASFLFAVLTFGLLASANPVPEAEKRAVTSESVVSNLQTTVNSITSQLQALKTNTPENSLKAQTLVNQLIVAIETANTQASSGLLIKRAESDEAVADVLSSVVSDIGEIFPPVIVIFPILGPLIASIDFALHELVISLDVVVFGLIGTLNGLLFGIAGILRGLGLTLFLGLLGL